MTTRFLFACFIVVAAVVNAGGRARADVFVIAPPWLDCSAPNDCKREGDEIVRAIQEDLSSDHRVLGPREVAALVKPEERVWCAGGACAERYREAAGAVATITIIVARVAAGEGPATSFQLGLQPSPGIEYTQGALMSDGPLRDIAVKAFREVFRRYRQGPGPWLEVVGGPKGASVFVDERPVGVLPLTIAIQTGSHSVRVEAQGFVPLSKVVSFATAADRRRLEFRLEPAGFAPFAPTRFARPSSSVADQRGGEKAPPASPRGREPSRLVWAGSGLLVGGAGLVAAPLVAMASADCTQRGPLGACVSEEDGLPRSAAVSLFVVGGVAATAGAVLLGLGLWRRPHASVDVQVGWGFVTLKGAY